MGMATATPSIHDERMFTELSLEEIFGPALATMDNKGPDNMLLTVNIIV